MKKNEGAILKFVNISLQSSLSLANERDEVSNFSKFLPHEETEKKLNLRKVKARFHYERGKEHSLFLLLIFSRLKLKQALSKAKKSIKQTKNNLFHARSGNGS